ncbi:hypothetical protein DZC73_21095 [Albitalea terrae]|uniref:Uncharacterized protein n=1 Tax=Piscinibacter terrae TaxID=2496871 RepID=A0A3N7IVG3_9BURK|nr:hypothetical protein DZC73_21095 [Albitalea terrae]
MTGGALAQGATGDNPSPSGDRSVDCDRTNYSSASGTGSDQPIQRSHRARSVARVNDGMHGNMPSAYKQCINSNDRSDRAQCVRQIYESRNGAAGNLTASNSTRRPC